MRLLQQHLIRRRKLDRRGSLWLSTTLFLATAVTAGRGFIVLPSLAETTTPATAKRFLSAKMSSKDATNTANTKNVVFEEGNAGLSSPKISSETSKEFLLNRPSGAYTTARTCSNASRIFEWEAHIERTAKSLKSMMEKREGDGAKLSELSDPFVLHRRLDAAVKQAVQLHQQQQQAGNDSDNEVAQSQELKITALVGWNATQTDEITTTRSTNNDFGWVACHVTSLPTLPQKPVRVEIRGSPRDNAAAKDSAWVSDRAPLEALMGSAECGPVNELLLANEQGQILEGSQTNFYAIINGSVWTASEGILEGTVRRLVLDVCEKEGIPVILEPPNLDTLESWEGSLISSTSRLALPIDQLYVPAEGLPSGTNDLRKEFDNEHSSIAATLQRLVSLEVEARSTPIGEPVA